METTRASRTSLEENREDRALWDLYRKCRLCPRECAVDRTQGRRGFCGETSTPRVAAIEAHRGEEPPISATRGSGTVFFTGCPLKCSFCQNHQISHEGLGRAMGVEELARALVCLQREKGVHNVNFVTPDHLLPHCMVLVRRLRRLGCNVPALYNLSGFQSLESLRLMEPCADIYLPDFKYSDRGLAARLSRCPDYPSVALEAISEMIRQKGFLRPLAEDSDGRPIPAQKGVLVRHLILPGHVRNSLDALTMLFVEFGRDLPLSIMSQYTPIKRPSALPELGRLLSPSEFSRVLDHALQLGFRNLFVQYPQEMDPEDRSFVPDFSHPRPFAGNI